MNFDVIVLRSAQVAELEEQEMVGRIAGWTGYVDKWGTSQAPNDDRKEARKHWTPPLFEGMTLNSDKKNDMTQNRDLAAIHF